jgi:hypothetical protein
MATGERGRTQTRSMTPGEQEKRSTERRGLVGQVGPLEIDWPKAVGYYGGLGMALAAGLIEPPIALFIAAVPLYKMLERPDASQLQWTAGEVLEGASTPVGGSGSPVIRITSDGGSRPVGVPFGRVFAPLRDIWTEAENVAHGDTHHPLQAKR